jgi:outer membrane protein OmpA-like peptidoglycan-associated protein
MFAVMLAASLAPGQQLNFIACPIVRDTPTVPCFLAEYEGETYYLGIQQGITAEFHPPQLKHEVLVEGTVAPGPRVCGGIPLQPLSISVRPELNLACNTILPAEPGIEAPPAPRGAGPSSHRPEPAARRPERTGVQEFTLLFAFEDTYVNYWANQVVTEAATYARRISAARVEVDGYRSAVNLSNGQRLEEPPELAEKRTRHVEKLLRGFGVENIVAVAHPDIEADPSPARRRVTIRVTP